MGMEQTIAEVQALIATYGLSVVGALVVLIVGWIAANWLSGLLNKALSRTDKVDATLRGFLVSLLRYGILTFTVVAMLNPEEWSSLVATGSRAAGSARP